MVHKCATVCWVALFKYAIQRLAQAARALLGRQRCRCTTHVGLHPTGVDGQHGDVWLLSLGATDHHVERGLAHTVKRRIAAGGLLLAAHDGADAGDHSFGLLNHGCDLRDDLHRTHHVGVHDGIEAVAGGRGAGTRAVHRARHIDGQVDFFTVELPRQPRVAGRVGHIEAQGLCAQRFESFQALIRAGRGDHACAAIDELAGQFKADATGCADEENGGHGICEGCGSEPLLANVRRGTSSIRPRGRPPTEVSQITPVPAPQPCLRHRQCTAWPGLFSGHGP
jgi:hypothetical protein